METVIDFIFLDSKITADGDYSHEINRHLLLGKAMTNLDSIVKSRDITLPTKVHVVKAMVFPVVLYRCELDRTEGWVPKNWCFSTVVLEMTLESPLDSKEIQPVHPKGNQSWIFTGRVDAEAEIPVLWPPDAKSWITGKDPDAGKDWRQEEKGMIEDETVGWHHRLDGHEQTLGVGDGLGCLACCSPWGHKELDTTERLNWTEWLWCCFSITDLCFLFSSVFSHAPGLWFSSPLAFFGVFAPVWLSAPHLQSASAQSLCSFPPHGLLLSSLTLHALNLPLLCLLSDREQKKLRLLSPGIRVLRTYAGEHDLNLLSLLVS